MLFFLASYGRREILLFGIFWIAAGVGAAFLHPAAAAVPALGLLFTLNFFRDPRRVPPGDSDQIVSPADGTVVEISEVEENEFLKGGAVKIGIFLSVWDVHVNRAPCDGVVKAKKYTPGRFVDARNPNCGMVNEQNAIYLEGGPTPAVVTQIAGAIARRIVCDVDENERLARGQKIGMIKFGSRTDIYLPKSRVAELRIKLKDKVKGGETVLARAAR